VHFVAASYVKISSPSHNFSNSIYDYVSANGMSSNQNLNDGENIKDLKFQKSRKNTRFVIDINSEFLTITPNLRNEPKNKKPYSCFHLEPESEESTNLIRSLEYEMRTIMVKII
jgi:hypothetical protein